MCECGYVSRAFLLSGHSNSFGFSILLFNTDESAAPSSPHTCCSRSQAFLKPRNLPWIPMSSRHHASRTHLWQRTQPSVPRLQAAESSIFSSSTTSPLTLGVISFHKSSPHASIASHASACVKTPRCCNPQFYMKTFRSFVVLLALDCVCVSTAWH